MKLGPKLTFIDMTLYVKLLGEPGLAGLHGKKRNEDTYYSIVSPSYV